MEKDLKTIDEIRTLALSLGESTPLTPATVEIVTLLCRRHLRLCQTMTSYHGGAEKHERLGLPAFTRIGESSLRLDSSSDRYAEESINTPQTRWSPFYNYPPSVLSPPASNYRRHP